MLPDGSLLRCHGAGLPTRDCLFADVLHDNATVLKVWNVNRGGSGAASSSSGSDVRQGEASATGGSSSVPLNGVVAALHLQGSSWDRSRRKFFVHDPAPKPLHVQV